MSNFDNTTENNSTTSNVTMAQPEKNNTTTNDQNNTSGPKPDIPTIRIPSDAVPYFKVARKLALSYNRALHHQKYLNECLEKRTIPKGLQLKVAAQIPEPNLDFTIKWEIAHLNFSKELTKLLSEYYQTRVNTLKESIETTKTSLITLCDTNTLQNIQNIIAKLEISQAEALQQRRNKKMTPEKPDNNKVAGPKKTQTTPHQD